MIWWSHTPSKVLNAQNVTSMITIRFGVAGVE